MKRIITAVIAITFLGSFYGQQDIHVSNFFASQNWLNPASAGFFEGDVRFYGDYRSQWTKISPNAFKTTSISVDGRILDENLKNGFLGSSINFYNDVTGDGIMKTNNVSANVNYAIDLDQYNRLAVGLNIGMLNRSLTFANFNWDSQWNGDSFDNSVSSGESGLNASFSKVDVGAGVYYYGMPSDNLRIYGGVGLKHLTKPNVSLYAGEDNLFMKVNINGGANISVPLKKMVFMPNFMVMLQGPNRVINVGTDVKYILKEPSHFTAFYDETSIALGAYYRAGDALFGTVRFSMKGVSLGISYDMTLSDLSKANNGFGAVEMMLMYRLSLGGGGYGKASF